jgi:hypothetical protein
MIDPLAPRFEESGRAGEPSSSKNHARLVLRYKSMTWVAAPGTTREHRKESRQSSAAPVVD